MTATVRSFRLNDKSRQQLAELAQQYGENESNVIRRLIGERYAREFGNEVSMYQIIYTTINEDMAEETHSLNIEIEHYFRGFRWRINNGQWCRTNEQGNGVFAESKNGIEQTTGTMQASFVSERQLATWLQDKLVPAWAIDQQLILIES